MEHVTKILEFVVASFIHIWPYLLVTIPLAVVMKMTGASLFIKRGFGANPVVAIIIATAIGAISPLCSCGVIPVITSLLIGGVPLAPVMSFWVASPSMDPEIFFLSVTTLGWELSTWRLVATFLISLGAGLLTHFAWQKGVLGQNFLRAGLTVTPDPKHTGTSIQSCCVTVPVKRNLFFDITKESWIAFSFVAKFMLIAFFINALIEFYLPATFVSGFVGGESSFSVIAAAVIGIPFYTSNLTALPLVSGFISLGMNEGAALAFLIAGPMTTLPAMMAVAGIVKPKIFAIYIAFALFGSILFGLLYNWVN